LGLKDKDNSLKDKDILQMDATIIARALVLLTVSSVAPKSVITYNLLIILATGIILTFGTSALSILRKNKSYGYGYHIGGFFTLLVATALVFAGTFGYTAYTILSPLLEGDNSNRTSSSNQSNSSMSSEVNNTKNFLLTPMR
jgi:uncharacterized membrane protein YccC